MSEVTFDQAYYEKLMREFGYSPLEFEPISFSLGNMHKEDLQRLWLCHMNGRAFAEASRAGKKVIVTTGFGMSGVPHAATLGQILRALRLQRSGIPVQIVLGDLDAFNGRNKSLDYTAKLADYYRRFIINLGFNLAPPNSLRNQRDSLTTLRLAYAIGHYMSDEMFNEAEEDVHELYSRAGKVDTLMSYRRKLSLNLMIADFLELLSHGGFDAVMVVLGADEHKYVNFGRIALSAAVDEHPEWFRGKHYSAMYSAVMRGFNGYPKMAKSFADSGISVGMPAEQIISLIEHGEVVTEFPETNVIYQMIAWASLYDNDRIQEAYEECRKQSAMWHAIKLDYAKHLHQLCELWKES